MIIEAIIPRRFWKNNKNGQTASIYGSHPSLSVDDDANWQIVESDFYSFVMSNGTISNFNQPKLTYAQALAIWESEKDSKGFQRIPKDYGIKD